MSAFLVSDSHLDAIVTAAIFGPAEVRDNPDMWSAPRFGVNNLPCSPVNGSFLGLWLLRENEVSMEARYPGRWGVPAEGYSFPSNMAEFKRLPALSILKLIDCYEYQSSEHEDWDDSWVRKFCQNLRARLIPHLPGYEEAPWALD